MYRLSCRISLGLSAIIGLAAICAEQASAQPPDSLQQFRFILSRSTLNVTGDFADVRQKFFPDGKFGLNAGYEGGPHAEFIGVDSRLVSESTFVWHTDGTLNLSGLEGTFSRPVIPAESFFKAVDGQGLPFHLTAVQRGRLLHLMGETIHPAAIYSNTSSMVRHTFYRIPTSISTAWSTNWTLISCRQTSARSLTPHSNRATPTATATSMATTFWPGMREIGLATPLIAFTGASSTSSALSSIAVPEPMTVVLLFSAAIAMLYVRRR